jgi:uncharacterized damage-inducible protein DinB
MNSLALTAQDVVAWHTRTTQEWRKLLTAHPEALTFPCDIAGSSVGELLQHIVAVELRYAERLADLPATDYAAVPFDTVASLYATHDRAAILFQQLLASPIDWDAVIEQATRTLGPIRSSRKAVFFHAHLHSIRHYGQLASLMRQHGIKPGWPMDYLAMHAQRA